MTDYVITTDFEAKDALPEGHPNKVVRGVELTEEFEPIRQAVASKYDDSDLATTTQAEDPLNNSTLITPLTLHHVLDQEGIAGDFVPLSGTTAPITGAIEFSLPAAAGGQWALDNTDLTGVNTFRLTTTSNSSAVQFVVRDGGGIEKEFNFKQDGSFLIPSQSDTGFFSIESVQYLGVDNVLYLKPVLSDGTTLDDSGVVIEVNGSNLFAFQQDGGLALPRDPTGPFEAATKQYVDAQLGPGSGETNTTSTSGTGVALTLPKSGTNLPFRGFTNPDSNITIFANGDDLELSLNSTTVNLGPASFAAGSTILEGLILNTTFHSNGEPTTDFVTSTGSADTLVRKDYVDFLIAGVQDVQVLAGNGLTGGGVIASDVTLNVVGGNGLDVTANAVAVDLAPTGGLFFDAGKVSVDPFVIVTVGTAQGISGLKTFSVVPRATADPVSSDDLARKSYVDGLVGGGDFLTTNTDQTGLTGRKTWDVAPRSTVNPTNDNDLARKLYVDSQVAFAVPITRNVFDGDGLSGGGDLSADLTLAVDSTVVRTSGAQTIGGIKTFTSAIHADYGTEALPGYAFDGDPDTGMFRHGVNDIGWSCGGDEKMYLDANSLVLDEAVTGSTAGASIVARNTMIVDNLSSGGGSTAAWGIASDLIIQSSDLRLKENVQPNPHGLAAVLQMDTIEFDWIKGEVHDIGFSAQNMVEIIPEACPENGDGYYGFRELPVMAALVKAVQELNAKVEELESKHGV